MVHGLHGQKRKPCAPARWRSGAHAAGSPAASRGQLPAASCCSAIRAVLPSSCHPPNCILRARGLRCSRARVLDCLRSAVLPCCRCCRAAGCRLPCCSCFVASFRRNSPACLLCSRQFVFYASWLISTLFRSSVPRALKTAPCPPRLSRLPRLPRQRAQLPGPSPHPPRPRRRRATGLRSWPPS